MPELLLAARSVTRLKSPLNATTINRKQIKTFINNSVFSPIFEKRTENESFNKATYIFNKKTPRIHSKIYNNASSRRLSMSTIASNLSIIPNSFKVSVRFGFNKVLCRVGDL